MGKQFAKVEMKNSLFTGRNLRQRQEGLKVRGGRQDNYIPHRIKGSEIIKKNLLEYNVSKFIIKYCTSASKVIIVILIHCVSSIK